MLLAFAMGLVASATVAGAAFAGSYQVSACAGTTPLINNSWQPFNSDPPSWKHQRTAGSMKSPAPTPKPPGSRQQTFWN